MPTVSGFVITLADRVRETTSTTGTGTYSLNGAVSGFRTFVAGVGSGLRCIYVAALGTSWEVGIGTVTSGAPATVSRDAILASTNSNNAVSWGAGTKDIFCDAGAALLNQIIEAPVINSKITTFGSSSTFTTDTKCLFAHVRIVGGGGAGGGADGTTTGHSSGSGGGGGEYAEGRFTAAQLGASQTVTIGAGGTGVSNGTGNTGGTTSLGGLITAIGGSGGGRHAQTTGNDQSAPGAGGTGGTGGYRRVAGGMGGQGMVRAGAWLSTGWGGSTPLAGNAIGDQVAGQLYGGGGSGAYNGASAGARAGAAGAAGLVIITEFLKP